VRPSTRRNGARILLGLGATGLLASLIALLAGLGLDNADKLSSVLGMLCSLFALAVAGLALRDSSTRSPSVAHRTAWDRRRIPVDVLDLLTATSAAANSPHSLMIDDRHTTLSTTYVRQRIEVPRPDAGPVPRRPGELPFLPPDQQPRVIPVRRPIDGTLDANRHVFLEGGPGSGKSTTAAQLCRQLAEGWLHGDAAAAALSGEPVIPILVTARQLAEYAALPWAEALAAALTVTLGTRLTQRVASELLSQAVDGVPWLVIIDGLDEVPADERVTLIGQLSGWAAADSPYRLLMTSRPLAGSVSVLFGTGSVGHYTLVPFDPALLTEFARRWFRAEDAPDADEAAARFVAEVRASSLLDVTATPLLAVVAIAVYADSPDRTLPRNRHDLYERYLQYLESFNRERRTSAMTRLAEVLGSGPEPSVAQALYARLDDLIEHLAVERVTSRNPLVPRAVAWLEEHGVPAAGPQPLRWNDHVVEALTASGLLTRRAETIDFLHLTFAEHLAARVHARELPARFDPAHDDWRRWVRRAMEDEHTAATAVLTRWTRRNSPAELLDSLLAGAQPANLVAARLVAEGAEVTPVQLEACLAVVEQRVRVAPYTQPWDLVRRFPDRPEVSRWLRRLVDDGALSASGKVALCRVHADRVEGSQPAMLARLREFGVRGHSAEAVAAAARAMVELAPRSGDAVAASLQDRLTDAAWLVGDRVTIASALLECGDEHRESAFRALREAMADPAAQIADVASAAETLAEAAVADRERLGQALSEAIERDRTDPHYRANAIETLVALDPARRDEAAALLHETATRDDDYLAVDAAVRLTKLSTGHRTEMVDRLSAIAGSLTAGGFLRMHAAGKLLNLDPAAAVEAVDLVAGLLRSPVLTLDDIDSLARSLAGADARTRAIMLHRLRTVRGELTPGSRRWQFVTIALAACDVTHQGEAEAVLAGIMADPRAAAELVSVVDVLKYHGSGPSERLVAALLTWACSETQPVGDRTMLMETICVSMPRHADQVTAAARRLSAAPAVTGEERARLLAFLVRFDPAWTSFVRAEDLRVLMAGMSGVAQLALPALLADPRTRAATRAAALGWIGDRRHDRQLRRTLAGAVTRDESTDRPAVEALLLEMMRERTADDAARVDTANMVAQRGGPGQAAATAVLLETLADPRCAVRTRLSAASALRALGSPADLAGTVRAVAADPMNSPGDRCLAAEALAALLEPTSVEPSSVLVDILVGLPDDPYGSGAILTAILKLAPDRRDLAVVYAQRALQQGGGWWATAAARILVALDDADGPGADSTCLSELPAGDDDSLLRAAERASWARPDDTAVSAVLWRIARRRSADQGHRIRALELLLSGHDQDRRQAAQRLGAAARGRPGRPDRGPAFGRLDPLSVAEVLLAAGPAQAAAAGSALLAVLEDPGETTGRRCRAARRLVESAATSHREAVARIAGPDLEGLGAEAAVVGYLATVVHRFAPDRRAGVLRVLQVRCQSRDKAVRREAATALLGLDPPDPLGRVVLMELARDNDLPDDDQVAAVGVLSRGNAVDREALADTMLEMMRGPGKLAHKVWAVRKACEAVPADCAAAIAFLTGVAGSDAPASDRLNAVIELAMLGWRPADQLDVLSAFLADDNLPSSVRRYAGLYLGYLPGPGRDAARRTVLRLPDPTARLAAAVYFAGVPGQSRADGLHALRTLAQDGQLAAAHRFRACTAMVSEGEAEDRAAAVAVLAGLVDDPKCHGWVRASALVPLTRAGGATATSTARRLWQTMHDPRADPEVRRWSAESLAELDGTLAARARDALLALAAEHGETRTGARLRRSARHIDLLGVRPA
jgi:hypothetical protein